MGLFRDLGERVERFKQQATDAAEDEAEYQCLDCETVVYTDRDQCPDCGSDAVVARASGATSSNPSGEADDVDGRSGESGTDSEATDGTDDASDAAPDSASDESLPSDT